MEEMREGCSSKRSNENISYPHIEPVDKFPWSEPIVKYYSWRKKSEPGYFIRMSKIVTEEPEKPKNWFEKNIGKYFRNIAKYLSKKRQKPFKYKSRIDPKNVEKKVIEIEKKGENW